MDGCKRRESKEEFNWRERERAGHEAIRGDGLDASQEYTEDSEENPEQRGLVVPGCYQSSSQHQRDHGEVGCFAVFASEDRAVD